MTPAPAAPAQTDIDASLLTQSASLASLRRVRGSGLVLAACLLAFFTAPLWWPIDPAAVVAVPLQAPNLGQPFGSDAEGRDLLARLLAGGRLAAIVGLGTAVLAVGVGAALGTLAGWRGGLVDALLCRVADVAAAFPGVLLALLILFVAESPSAATVIVSLAATGWASSFRLVRGLVLALRRREDLLAVALYGTSTPRLLALHVAPEIAGPLAVQATFTSASAVLGEASLSFLGFGPPSGASWGALLEDGVLLALGSPWLLLLPAGALCVWQAGLLTLADGLRDWLDPRNDADLGAVTLAKNNRAGPDGASVRLVGVGGSASGASVPPPQERRRP